MNREHIKPEHIKKILFVPRIEKGKGGGHFIRCSKYVEELRCENIEASIYIPLEIQNSELMNQLSSIAKINPSWIISSNPEKNNWSCIILDNFQTSETEYFFWKKIAPVIAIDEGGSKRDSFDFLIDILPKLSGGSCANISRPSFLSLPQKRRKQFVKYYEKDFLQAPLKVLVVFGAEDASGMGIIIAKKLAAMNNLSIDVILKNPQQDENALPQNINCIEPFPALKETLHQYDFIITHYGITAFEAIYARVPVLIMSPTKYHEQLALEIGFTSLGIKKQAVKNMKNFIKYFAAFMEMSIATSEIIFQEQGFGAEQSQSLIDFIKSIDCKVPRNCPVCGEPSLKHAIVARFYDRTYRRCKNCSVEYMLRLEAPSIQYTEDYFFSDYKKQYGKTYLEDFPHLVEMAKSRLLQINNLLQIKKIVKKTKDDKPLRLLDIGCAYGPFLKAAQDEGFEVFGIDPSDSAVKYVTDTLGIPAVQGFFPDINLSQDILLDGFDVISLWYVIEHFEDTKSALTKISSWLKPGGVLAFSTPSGMGISARRSRIRFLEKSPADHWTIWKPQKIQKALNPYKIQVKKTIITGHHPERFPFVHKKKGLLYQIVYILSNYFKLGDTFEAYSVKR
jgi:2-polyprenyl-3-methyl-5-hydroxy-6-metoxy-1,4-benzoquinol methylase/spore coat polysaccharide biosynthesis predicted glycosyltransferase SpsG